MKRILKLTMLMSSLAFSSVSSYGISIDHSGGVTRLYTGDHMLGYSFTTTGMNVARVGIFDVGFDGLNSDHRVGVWDSVGNLLIDQIVSVGGSTSVSASTLGQWVSTALSGGSYYLDAGTYTIGAFYGGSSDAIVYSATAINNSAIYGQGKYLQGNTFGKPTLHYEGGQENQYFGPGIFASVPESGSTGLLLGFGILGLAAIRRKLS